MKSTAATATIALLVLAAGSAAAAENAASGSQIYANNCASCHGPTGEGNGPVAAVLNVNVPNLRNLAERNHGVFPTADVRAYIDGRNLPAAHGDRYMPIWGAEFGWGGKGKAATEKLIAERIDAVVDYLKKLQYRK